MSSSVEPLTFFNCKDFNWHDSMSVVGSSAILNHRDDSKNIDSNDDVMRFNHAVVEGFEQVCGAKTTFMLINEHSLHHEEEAFFQSVIADFPKTKRYYIRDFENLNVIIRFNFPSNNANYNTYKESIDMLSEKNNVAFISSEFFDYYTNMLNKKPSCGFFGIMIALYYYNKVDCFGFNFNQNPDIDKHYFEKGNSSGGVHDLNKEQDLIKDLHEQKLLSLFC